MTRKVVTGLAEVVINVRDLPRMREFYLDVLGLRLLNEACVETDDGPTPDGEPTISFLTVSPLDTPLGRHGHPALLALIDHRRHALARARFRGHERSTSTLNHVAFEIPPSRYTRERARLDRLGLAPRTMRFPEMSARAIFFEDPEGNELELICYDDGERAPADPSDGRDA